MLMLFMRESTYSVFMCVYVCEGGSSHAEIFSLLLLQQEAFIHTANQQQAFHRSFRSFISIFCYTFLYLFLITFTKLNASLQYFRYF